MPRAALIYDYSRRTSEWTIQRPRFTSPCWKAEPRRERFLETPNDPPSEGEVIEAKFRKLVDQWRAESEHLSSAKSAMALDSYRQIVKMGQPVVRLILLELKERPHFWFGALREITGAKELGKNFKFKEAIAAWLKWGYDNDYLHQGPS